MISPFNKINFKVLESTFGFSFLKSIYPKKCEKFDGNKYSHLQKNLQKSQNEEFEVT